MSELIDEFVKGRKTFFILPDKSLFPESYLEEYLSRDFECYFVNYDRTTTIQNKIESILNVFDDAIIFFNIDFQIPNLKWSEYISDLVKKYNNAKFGIIYAKRQSSQIKSAIEQLYLYHIGLQCGCIQLEYQKSTNFGIIEKTLYANQAMGRRKSVRALCPSGCGFDYTTDLGQRITGKINDISISHFSCICRDELDLSDFQKCNDIRVRVKGVQFQTNAILCMKRNTDQGMLYVFAFTTKNGQNGLDILNRQLLVPKMYEILTTSFNSLIHPFSA